MSMGRLSKRLSAAGFTGALVWVAKASHASIGDLAKRLGVSRRIILHAALDLGLRRLTTSDIQRAQMAWRQYVSEPSPSLMKSGRYRRIFDPITHRIIRVEKVS